MGELGDDKETCKVGGGEIMVKKKSSSSSSLTKLGFTEPSSTIIPRLISSISGLDKQGKTHFGLTMPAPIVLFNTDIGEEGVMHKFDGKVEHAMDVGVPAEEESEDAEGVWKKFKAGYYGALEASDDDCRSLLIDTGTEVWELMRLAEFGQLAQIMPYMYGPVNAKFRRLVRDSYKYNKNVMWLHKMKPKYVNDKRTAEYERSGFGDMPFLVQLNAQIWRYDVEDGGEFVLTVTNSRHEPDLIGEELEGGMCNFPTLASLVLPDVDVDYWE